MDKKKTKKKDIVYYKSLRPDLCSFYDPGFRWKEKGITKVTKVDKNSAPCGIGLHLSKSIESVFIGSKFPVRIFEAKVVGEIFGQDNTKIRTNAAKLGKEIELPKWIKSINKFMSSISKINFLDNHGCPKKEWKLFNTRDAACNAAYDTAYDAAHDAARNAAYNAAYDAAHDAAYDAARNAAHDAAYDAAHDAAHDAACDAAGYAAGYAAHDAACDAGLLAKCLITCDKKNSKKNYLDYARKRWEVWKQGYGLYEDINGVFYCYKKL
jgi:hypothetical protein